MGFNSSEILQKHASWVGAVYSVHTDVLFKTSFSHMALLHKMEIDKKLDMIIHKR